MDTSNRQGRTELLALDAINVSSEDLNPGEWAAIIEKVIADFKPQLKYFTLETIEKKFDRQESGVCVVVDPQIIEYCEGVNDQTRCLSLAKVSRNTSEGRDEASGDIILYFKEEDLLLSSDGRIIFWSHERSRTISPDVDFPSQILVVEHIVSCRFSVLTVEDLISLKDGEGQSFLKKDGLYVFISLINAITTTINTKSQQLGKLRQRRSVAMEILSRISG